MVNWQARSKRKPTGARLKQFSGKRKRDLGREETRTQLGAENKKIVRTRGDNIKIKLASSEYVNLTDPKTGKTKRVKIVDVEKNPANIDFDRRGVITRGAIINTSAGKARVTSRPGQTGIINAVLIKTEK
ncbi:MAG: 30S ribosomal protein S8e [Candidatus Jordarchaeum sp.]|uniref:30S ribosomal protein S8e n=1 Tax=Candidatus Jordarchaeum sp. TaxID=2823881 RepID=UPI004048EB2B